MSAESLIALLAFLGTCAGSLCGVMASNKLTLHRIAQLEKKVEKHNNLMERLYKIEEKVELMENH
jgi:tetrahydromethanopterin S-methyltransferase subunit G